jgi:hypothetical protein
MTTDYNNLLIAESEGASPEEHVSHIAEMRENAERYLAIRRYALLSLDDALEIDAEMPSGHGETNESFDAAADRVIELLAAKDGS